MAKDKKKMQPAAPPEIAKLDAAILPTMATAPEAARQAAQTDLFASTPVYARPFYLQPTGQYFKNIGKLLSWGSKIEDKEALLTSKERTALLSHGADIAINSGKNSYEITFKKGEEETVIVVPDVKKLAGNNKAAIMIFDIIMGELSKGVLYNAMLQAHTIEFPLTMLVEYGIYSRIDNAVRGWSKATDILLNMPVKVITKRGKNNIISSEEKAHIFDMFKYAANNCYVLMNSAVNWKALVSGYAYMPTWTFKLSSNGYWLARNVYHLARVKKADFSVDVKNVQEWLNLPDENKTAKNQIKLIKQPIEDAVNEFNMLATAENDQQLALTLLVEVPSDIKRHTVKQWLNNTKLEVKVSGQLAEILADISSKQQDIIARRLAILEQKQKKPMEQKTNENTPKMAGAGT